MSNSDTQLIGLAMIASGFILAIVVVVYVINRQPRHARTTNTPEEAQRILNNFFSGYTGDNDSSDDSIPVNALSSAESLPLREFIVLSGDSVIVMARSEAEALIKYYAECNDEECPCGRPQYYEPGKPETDVCDCISSNETLTWAREDIVE